MLITDEKEYEQVWEWVYDEFKFQPSIYPNKAFELSVPHVIYDISKHTDEQLDNMQFFITNAFINCTTKKSQMYALDWHHSAFRFNPRNADDMKSFKVEDDRYQGGGYHAYFPSYYPDGDYYFFIDTDFRFGYLGHPWQQNVWVFGETLISEFEKIYSLIGFEKIEI